MSLAQEAMDILGKTSGGLNETPLSYREYGVCIVWSAWTEASVRHSSNRGEVSEGWFYHGKHLDVFWNVTEDGKSYLDEKLKGLAIDTIVIAGLAAGIQHSRGLLNSVSIKSGKVYPAHKGSR